MDTPRGRILSVRNDATARLALVEVLAAPRCARCAAGKGCGAGLLAGGETPRRVEAMVAGGLAVNEGDEVRIDLAPENLLRASAIVYGLPLAGAVLAAGAAWLASLADLAAAAAALAGAVLGAGVARLRLRRATCLAQFTPTVTARLVPAGD